MVLAPFRSGGVFVGVQPRGFSGPRPSLIDVREGQSPACVCPPAEGLVSGCLGSCPVALGSISLMVNILFGRVVTNVAPLPGFPTCSDQMKEESTWV